MEELYPVAASHVASAWAIGHDSTLAVLSRPRITSILSRLPNRGRDLSGSWPRAHGYRRIGPLLYLLARA